MFTGKDSPQGKLETALGSSTDGLEYFSQRVNQH